MATICELIHYLEQGYIAVDHGRIGPAYLTPFKQEDELMFKWNAYQMEGEWSKLHIYTKEDVCSWCSDGWGILCSTNGTEYDEQDPARIDQAIVQGLVYKE